MQGGLLERGAALLVAISPGLPIAVLLLNLGRTLKPSVGLLAFGMGAFAALSALLGIVLTPLAAQVADPVLRAAFRAFGLAAAPEEAAKLFVLVSIVLAHEDADERQDAVLAGAWIGLGFGLLENVFYVVGNSGWAALGFFRAMTAVPSHVALGLVMGLMARSGRYTLAFAVPFLLHGLYDWPVFAADERPTGGDAEFLAWGALLGAVLLIEWLVIRGPACRAIVASAAAPHGRVERRSVEALWVRVILIGLFLLSSALVGVIGVTLAFRDARLVVLAAGAVMPLAFLDLFVRYRRLTRIAAPSGSTAHVHAQSSRPAGAADPGAPPSLSREGAFE